MSQLKQIIKDRIKQKGLLPFDEFMEMALYYPGLGYYTREDIKIGRSGDFFTASHLGEVFGLLLSRQIEIFRQRLDCSWEFTVTEIGPGTGHLAKDILQCLHEIKYNLVEINPWLVEHQKKMLQPMKEATIKWFTSIEQLEPFTGVIICNEILDAFPVRIVETVNGGLMEVYVTADENDELEEVLLPARKDTTEYIKEFAPWILDYEKYRTEVNLAIKPFIEKLSKVLKNGYLLIFDYGYDSEQYYHLHRNKGTLLCYYKHTINENPYINIGRQDITAHINFTALEKWANEFGFKLEGYFSQGSYLVSLCNEEVLEKIQQKNLIQQFKRLVLPQGMGESHRVMILSKN